MYLHKTQYSVVKNELITRKKILIAPLNWGLGHATRCIPIIEALIKENFQPVIASDGDSLKLLQKEFPNLKSYKLPAYNIKYTKNGKNLKLKLLFNALQIFKAAKKEQKVVNDIIKKEGIIGLISDNRFGVFSKKIPSVYITHQIQVLSGFTTFITSKFHQKIIAKFDECWVPDYEGKINLAGKLSHISNKKLNIKYIDPISRFDNKILSFEGMTNNKKYDLLILLSGPEPQRSILEEKLLKELKNYNKNTLFVRGVVSDKEKINNNILIKKENIHIVNFMLQNELQKAINDSKIIIARSGYSTIMDLETLKAKAFFIPTPGQYEQEYLAKYLKNQNIAPYTDQDSFKIEMLLEVKNYDGFVYKNTVKENKIPLTIFKII